MKNSSGDSRTYAWATPTMSDEIAEPLQHLEQQAGSHDSQHQGDTQDHIQRLQREIQRLSAQAARQHDLLRLESQANEVLRDEATRLDGKLQLVQQEVSGLRDALARQAQHSSVTIWQLQQEAARLKQQLGAHVTPHPMSERFTELCIECEDLKEREASQKRRIAELEEQLAASHRVTEMQTVQICSMRAQIICSGRAFDRKAACARGLKRMNEQLALQNGKKVCEEQEEPYTDGYSVDLLGMDAGL